MIPTIVAAGFVSGLEELWEHNPGFTVTLPSGYHDPQLTNGETDCEMKMCPKAKTTNNW